MSELIKKEDQHLTITEKVVELNSGTKKMRNYNDSDWQKIAVELTGLSVLLGVKDITPDQIKYIVDFFKAQTKDFSWSEFKYALELNIAGKLDSMVKPYGSILNYVGSILSEYRNFRRKHLAKSKHQPTPEEIEAEKKKKMAEFNMDMQNVFFDLNERFKLKKYDFTYSEGILFYDCLSHLDIIPEYKTTAPEVAKELWNKSKRQAVEYLAGSSDKETKQILKSFSEAVELDQKQESRKKAIITSLYKGNLLLKFLEECEIFNDLIEAKESLKK